MTARAIRAYHGNGYSAVVPLEYTHLATLIRNLFVTALVLAATVATVTLQQGQAGQSGNGPFFWFLYATDVAWALIILLHRATQ